MILYKIVFALFYELGSGQWPPEFDADIHKGVLGASLLEAVFALSVSGIIEANLRRKLEIPHWCLWGGFLGLSGLNYYLLVSLKIGTDFLHELKHYQRSKRVLLYCVASGLVIIVGIFFLYSVKLFHHAFLL